jgi:hypothetical protein
MSKVAETKMKKAPLRQVALTKSYRETLLGVAGTTVAEVREKLGLSEADLADIDLWFEREYPDLVKLVKRNHKNAAMLTTRYLREHAALAGFQVGADPAKIVEEQLAKSLSATGPGAFKKHIAGGGSEAEALEVMQTTLPGSAERLAMNGARETLVGAVEDLGSPVLGYTRRTSGQACAYCQGLSTEPVYAGTDGVKTFHAHDHCTCIGEPFYLDATRKKVDRLWVAEEEFTKGFAEEQRIQQATEAWRNRADFNADLFYENMLKGRVEEITPQSSSYFYYFDGGYDAINGYLRGLAEFADAGDLAQRMVEAFDDAGLVLEENIALWRGYIGTDKKNWKKIFKVGEIVEDPGVSSATVSQAFAEKWIREFRPQGEMTEGSVVAKILAPEGTRVLGGVSSDSFAKEIMLPPGTKLEVVRVEEEDGITFVIMRMVSDGR